MGYSAKISNVSVAASTISVGWFIPNENDDGYEDRNVQVGDTINFNYLGYHNVYIHPSQGCSQDGAIVVGATSSNGDSSYMFQSSDVGKMTFACDVGSHCEMGQIQTVTVESASSEGTNDPAVTDPPADDPPTDPPNAMKEPKDDDPPATSSYVDNGNKFLGFALNAILLYAFIAV